MSKSAKPPESIEDDDEEFKSRTQKKLEAEAAQQLGERLVNLPDKQLDKLDLPESLYDAIKQAGVINAHGGKKRQLQFIGKLMRDEKLDLEPIKSFFVSFDGVKNADVRAFKQMEVWREKLVQEGVSAVNELQKQYPDIDAQQLRQLVRNAKKNDNDKLVTKSKRAIFQILKQIFSTD